MTDLQTIADLTVDQQLKLWGCFVTTTRYGGSYEGGRWAAFTRESAAEWVFNLTPAQVELSGDPFGEDMDCERWWKNHALLVGSAHSPDAAVLNLIDKLEAVTV